MAKIAALPVAAMFVLLGAAGASAADDWPKRPIDVVLGWSAGGTSDTTVRALAREMTDFLGVELRITNMDGANGGIAYQNVYMAPADGYKLFGGAQVQATYPITKQAKVGWMESYSFPAGMGTTTIYVKSDSPYKTLPDLVTAIKNSSKTVSYGSTSRGGNGSIFGEAFANAAGIADKVQEVPYNGGREAGRYLLSGAVEYISVSIGDVSDWAEAGTLRPLANLFPKDYVWRGVTFPSINHWYPELEIYKSINPYWGIAVRRDTPAPIVLKLAEAFAHAVKQKRFKDALDSRTILVAPLLGDDADQAAAMVGSGRGWAAFEYGIVKTSPAEIGMPKLQEWKWPYNDAVKNLRKWPEGIEKFAKAIQE